ncbi:hypothetical protein ACIQI7_01640 [Kitasatospora sp. NPDC092039]|uniref:hypothetical protein n=1 Tax=Kitasatospora sp. NPDC092039 TaxID=3364086 RepID=UPI00382D8B12
MRAGTVDGFTACSTASGFTYDFAGSSTSCSLTQGVPSTTFHLRTPVGGMWACSVPSGFTYSATTSNRDCATVRNVPTTKFLPAR